MLARQRFREYQNKKSLTLDYQESSESSGSATPLSSSESPTENEFISIDATRSRFSQKQLGMLKRVITNFLIYRFKSKMVYCFQKWQKKPKPPQVAKRVGFKLEAQSPTKKAVKNVLLQKNKKMLVRVLTAWSQYAQ